MFFTKTTLYEHQIGVLTRDGVVVGTLDPGRHRLRKGRDRLWRFARGTQSHYMHGQEMTTSDGGTVRINLSFWWSLQDPLLFARSGGLADALEQGSIGFFRESIEGTSPLSLVAQTAQVFLREWVASRTLEQAQSDRAQLAEDLVPAVATLSESLGIKIERALVIDFGVTGGLRAAQADLLKAELEGQAALQRARNEAATMRSLLNTARLIKDHPGLMELRLLTSGIRPRINVNIGPLAPGQSATGDDPESES